MKCKVKSEKLRSEKGSVLLLVTVALAAVMGIVGLAMDAGQLYVTNQQAQAAADAAVLAGAMDLYNSTGFNAPGLGFTGGSISCGAASTQSPCVYARLNGFSTPDTVTIKFRGCTIPPGIGVLPPVGLAAGDLICATVSRVVPTTFMRVLGIGMSTVTATASAAIIGGRTVTPLVVTHPALSGALTLGAGSSIVICGGPSIGIQINSNSPTALISGGGTVDLSLAGPPGNDSCAGTGSAFRVVGGPAAEPAGISLGTAAYFSGVSAITDPFASVAAPAAPTAAPATSTVVSGVDGCLTASCTLYSPGSYPTGISVSGNALFLPGIYYMTSGGFQGLTGGCMAMATGVAADPATGWTENMLVYSTGGGAFGTSGSFGQGCAQNFLLGSPVDSTYEGILFFQDRNSAAALTHNFAGSGSFALTGTIYLNDTNSAQYQTLNLNGGPITVNGDIVVSQLSLTGSSLTMYLVSAQSSIKQVALVQ